MRRLLYSLCLICLLPFLTGANSQSPLNEMVIGFLIPQPQAGVTAFQQNAAANWYGLGFWSNLDKTVSEVQLYFSAVAGSPIAADASLELQADTAAAPSGTSLQTVTASGAPGASETTFTGFSTAITNHTHYWLVLKNLNATPATNNWSVRYSSNTGTGVVPDYGMGGLRQNGWSWGVKTSTNSGGAWSDASVGGFFGRIKFSDGTYIGVPFENVAGSGTDIYGTTEAGVKFTIPATWPTLKTMCLSTMIVKAGTPGNLRYRLYTGTSTTPGAPVTTGVLPVANVISNDWDPLCFSTVQGLTPGTTYRFTVGQTAGNGSNYYNIYRATLDNTAASKAIMSPFGELQFTSTADGTTFTDTAGFGMPFGLVLDVNQHFSVPSGTVTITRNPFNGGFNP